MFGNNKFSARDFYRQMFGNAEDIGMGAELRYRGDFKHKVFPHFFQFETVYYAPDNTFYTVIEHMPDGTYAIIPTVEYDRGEVCVKYKAYHWSLEKLLD